MKSCQNRIVKFCLATSLVAFALSANAFAADVTLSMNATGEEQQTNQPGLIFNNAIFGQTFPTAPNYFVSTRVTAGRRISYQATVTNVDAVASPNIVVGIVFPVGVTLYQGSLSTSLGSCQVQTPGDPDFNLVCDVGVLAAGASANILFQVIVDPNIEAGDILLGGGAATISGDTNLSNNFATTQNTVLGAADLTVALGTIGVVSTYNSAQGRILDAQAVNGVTAGNVVRHRVELQNNGPSDAATGLVKHSLPAGFALDSADGARCIPSGTGLNQVFCAISNLQAGARAAYDLNVAVDPFVANLSVLQSCTNAIGGASNTIPPGAPPAIGFDPPLQTLTWDPITSTGNESCTSTTTGVLVDAGVGFASTSISADERGAVQYRPVVQNYGRSGLLTGTMTLTFPTGIRPLGASNECVVLNTTATCAVPPLSPGESQSFEVVGRLELVSASATALSVQAALSGVNPSDANSGNNASSAITMVSPRFDSSDSKLSVSARNSDFEIQSGTWGVNSRGEFLAFELGTARALVKPSILESFSSGKLATSIRLARAGKNRPNGSLIFSHQSKKNYRFVRVEKRGRSGKVVLGQVGDFGGEKSGVMAKATYPLRTGRVYNLSLELSQDGIVDVRINNSSRPVLKYSLTTNPQIGRIGLETRKARAVYGELLVSK